MTPYLLAFKHGTSYFGSFHTSRDIAIFVNWINFHLTAVNFKKIPGGEWGLATDKILLMR